MKVVHEILSVIDTLHIEAIFLQNSKLARVVKVYAKNRPNMSTVQDLAKRIIDKWGRMVFGISTSYYDGAHLVDDEGDNYAHENDQYRDLRRKIDRMKARSRAGAEEEEPEEEEGAAAKKKKQQVSEAQE